MKIKTTKLSELALSRELMYWYQKMTTQKDLSLKSQKKRGSNLKKYAKKINAIIYFRILMTSYKKTWELSMTMCYKWMKHKQLNRALTKSIINEWRREVTKKITSFILRTNIKASGICSWQSFWLLLVWWLLSVLLLMILKMSIPKVKLSITLSIVYS